jgi:hypothetical protein
MSSPVVTVLGSATVSRAAEIIARSELHHLVVTNAAGSAVGFVSAIDIIRAQLGWIPAQVPVDARPPGGLDLEWSGDEEFSQIGLQAATEGPGLFVLTRITDEHPPNIIWADRSEHVKSDLQHLLADPPAAIARVLERGRLHYRCAVVEDPTHRQDALRRVVASAAW